MTATALRNGDTICYKGDEVKVKRVKRHFPKRGSGVYTFSVDVELLDGQRLIFNKDDSVLIIERDRVYKRYD